MNQSAIYIFSPGISHSNNADLTNLFSEPDKDFFRNTLFLNLIENALRRKEKADLFIILHEKEVTTELQSISDLNLIITDKLSPRVLLSENIIKEFNNHKYNMLVSGNVVDIRSSDFDKYVNLLGIDEKTILISKSSPDTISVFGFCGYSESLLGYFVESELSLQNFLSFNTSCEYYITMAKDIFTVNALNDFKRLYSDLSQKSSLEYCSQEMHERFTHLFVEYKDLLK